MEAIDYEEGGVLQGPGWKQLQASVESLRHNLNTLCDSLEVIVNLENTKLLATGRVEIPDTSRRILSREQKFIEKFRSKMTDVKRIELDGGDMCPKYAILYQSLNKHIQDSIVDLADGLRKQLSVKTKAAQEVIEENQAMMEKLHAKEKEVMNEQRRSETASREKNTLAARCKKLEQLIEEKNQKIQQLQKESTVVLWKREKQRLIGNIYSREMGLEKQLETTSMEADDTKHRLERRIEDLQNKVRMEQFRNSTKSSISYQEVGMLRRNLFLKERLYVVAESELRKQRNYYLGLMEGLRIDYRMAQSSTIQMTDVHIDVRPNTTKNIEFSTRMDKIIHALEDGTINKLRSTLPSYYLSHNSVKVNDLKKFEAQVRRRQSTTFIVKTSDEEEKNLERTDLGQSLVKWRLGEENPPTLAKLLRDIQKEHPLFVDDEGKLLINEVVMYFPDLSEEKISHYFNIFSMWDDNGDMNLDTTEILHNMPGILGNMSTTEEVADAIREIDIDESGTIDFYEFLLLIQRLYNDNCQSAFFQKNDFLKVSSTHLSDSNSKVCSIQ